MKKKEYKKFEEELKKVRLDTAKFLCELLIAVSFITLLIYIYNLASKTKLSILNLFLTLIVFTLSLFIRFSIKKTSLRIYSIILVLIFSFIIFFTMLSQGIDNNTMVYLILIFETLSVLVLFGSKIAIAFFMVIDLFIVIIEVLQVHHLISIPLKDYSINGLSGILMIISLIWIILRVGLLIYSLIHKSYKYALKYSNEIETLTGSVDNQLNEYINNLQNHYKDYVEKTEINFTLGAITKSIIHDLSVSVNAVNEGFEILKKRNLRNKRLLNKLSDSINQINRIVFETRELIQGKEVIDVFEVSYHINTVIRILQNEIRNNNIKIKYKTINKSFLKGTPGLFERIIMNILLNAIEELSNKAGKREISISSETINNLVEVEIKNNGKGIPNSLINDIFTSGYSLKANSFNLGLGLTFIKECIENKFGGNIVVKSKEGFFTKFNLSFISYSNN